MLLVLLVLLGFWLVVGSVSAYVALFVPDEARTKRAFEVLRLVVRYGLGASAGAALVAMLDKSGGVDVLNLIGW